MSKVINQYGVKVNRCTTYAAIEVKKGSEIINATWDKWGVQVFVMEDDEVVDKITKEVIIVATGYTVHTHDNQGLLIRVLQHLGTIEPCAGEYLHIFENTKR